MSWLHRYVGATEPKTSKSEDRRWYAMAFTLGAIQACECLPGSDEEEEMHQFMTWAQQKQESL